MTIHPPTPAATARLALALMAVWIIVVFGKGLLWPGVFATIGAVVTWWLIHRDAQPLRSRAATLERAMHKIAELASTSNPEPEELADLVREQLTTATENARACKAVVEVIVEPIVVLDAQGTIVSANRAAAALLIPGSSGRMQGELLDQLLPDERALSATTTAQQGEPARAQARLLTSQGPRIIEIAAEPIAGQPFGIMNPPTVVVSLRDITEQAHAMQLKTDFVANASHELRTPLASIKAAAETLREVGGDDPAMRERLISMIASNADRLEELSRDLLDLSSLESPEAACVIECVDLHEVAAGLGELFAEPCAQQRITLKFDLDDRLVATWTDARLVRLVLRNLIDNAVKFANAETVVLVRGTVSATPTNADATDRLDATLEVIDKGIGIPLAQQQRIFERFFQADEARTGATTRRGTGLGLAIVKHALRALGGTIKVESVWQQGTTMTVELPGCVDNGCQEPIPGDQSPES